MGDKFGLVKVLPRFRRQTSAPWQCPAVAATSRSSKSQAYLAFYSPDSRQDQNVYQARSNWKASDIDRIVESGAFDTRKPTVIYTHGYTQTIDRPWLKLIRRNFNQMYPIDGVREPEFNLIFFDWSDYGQRAYGTSVSYAAYLGKLLSEFINDHLTKRYNYRANQVHIVSYSLSTHIAGQAGRRLAAQGNPLAQITAVDPTGVCFHQEPGKFADKHQLRPGDAKLVVARHYDMNGLGAKRPIGGVDIFVNGGSNQPAMSVQGQYSMFALLSSMGGASSHVRASTHESEQFDPSCQEVAYSCRSYKAYLAGECASCGSTGNGCFLVSTFGAIELGLKPPTQGYKNGTKMYLTTGRKQFCLHAYQVVAKLSNKATKSDIRAFESGAFSSLVAPADQLEGGNDPIIVNPSHQVSTNGGQIQFTQLLQLNSRIKRFEDQIKVKGLSNLRALESLQINYMSNISPKERNANSIRYCPKGNDYLVRC